MPDAAPTKTKRKPQSRSRKFFLGIIAAGLTLTLLEGLASIGWTAHEIFELWSNGPRAVELKEEYHCEYDSELGWKNRPGASIVDFYGPGQSITINENGLRSHEPLTDSLKPNAMRAACLGDSFTLGYGVDDKATFPYLLQQRSNGSLNVFNMGQGGYSIGQNWLWLRRLAPKLKPDVVVCVFIVEDFGRLGTTRTANGFGAPQFVITDTGVSVRNIPVPEKLSSGELIIQPGAVGNTLRRNSGLARTLSLVLPDSTSPDDETLLITGLYLVREIQNLCKKQDCEVVFALTPTLPELLAIDQRVRYEQFSQSIQQFTSIENMPYLDLQEAFLAQKDRINDLFLDEKFHHYSAAGNNLVAEKLHEWLSRIIAGYPPS